MVSSILQNHWLDNQKCFKILSLILNYLKFKKAGFASKTDGGMNVNDYIKYRFNIMFPKNCSVGLLWNSSRPFLSYYY